MFWDDVGACPALRGVELQVPLGSTTVVVGQTGAGKSALLQAMVGDLMLQGGQVHLAGTVAYCSQVPWIQNATMCDNILFGSPWDERWYNTVVEACALEDDFRVLPASDQTEIGEKGINLSGGQKARVALARAVYAAADIYLLENVFEAVDEHVGTHLWQRLFGNDDALLKNKTTVLVTHALRWLPNADQVVVVQAGEPVEEELVATEGKEGKEGKEDSTGGSGSSGGDGGKKDPTEKKLRHSGGRIAQVGSYDELMKIEDGPFKLWMTQIKEGTRGRGNSSDGGGGGAGETAGDTVDDTDAASLAASPASPTDGKKKKKKLDAFYGSDDEVPAAADAAGGADDAGESKTEAGSSSRAAATSIPSTACAAGEPPKPSTDKGGLVGEEKNEEGSVASAVYCEYIRATGGPIFAATLITSLIFASVCNIGSSRWLAYWSSNSKSANNATSTNTTNATNNVLSSAPTVYTADFYVGIYSVISVGYDWLHIYIIFSVAKYLH